MQQCARIRIDHSNRPLSARIETAGRLRRNPKDPGSLGLAKPAPYLLRKLNLSLGANLDKAAAHLFHQGERTSGIRTGDRRRRHGDEALRFGNSDKRGQ